MPLSSPPVAAGSRRLTRQRLRDVVALLAAVAALLAAGILAHGGTQTLGAATLVFVALGLVVWRARQEAREAAEARREYLTGMGHELRTPLNSVIGFSNVLLKNRSGRLTPVELEYVERVRANGERLLTVVDDLMADDSPIVAGGDGVPTRPSAGSPASPPRVAER